MLLCSAASQTRRVSVVSQTEQIEMAGHNPTRLSRPRAETVVWQKMSSRVAKLDLSAHPKRCHQAPTLPMRINPWVCHGPTLRVAALR